MFPVGLLLQGQLQGARAIPALLQVLVLHQHVITLS